MVGARTVCVHGPRRAVTFVTIPALGSIRGWAMIHTSKRRARCLADDNRRGGWDEESNERGSAVDAGIDWFHGLRALGRGVL